MDEHEKTLLEAAVKELGPSIEKVGVISSIIAYSSAGHLIPASSPQAVEPKL